MVDASDEVRDASDEDEDADGEQQSGLNKHREQITKIKRYALDRRPASGVRTLVQDNMDNFGERLQANFAELVETERLQQGAVVVFQERGKEMADRFASILDKTSNEGKEDPANWETEFAHLVSER